jgi:hypothetical protein
MDKEASIRTTERHESSEAKPKKQAAKDVGKQKALEAS